MTTPLARTAGSSASTSAEEIRDLMYEYCWLVDRAEFDAMGELFAHAVTRNGTDPGIEMRGAAEIADLYRGHHRLYTAGDGTSTPYVKHVCTNVILDVDDAAGRATARSKYVVQQAVAETGFALQAIVAGRYHDTFERVDGAWRFSERIFYVDFLGDLSAHHQMSPEPTEPTEPQSPQSPQSPQEL